MSFNSAVFNYERNETMLSGKHFRQKTMVTAYETDNVKNEPVIHELSLDTSTGIYEMNDATRFLYDPVTQTIQTSSRPHMLTYKSYKLPLKAQIEMKTQTSSTSISLLFGNICYVGQNRRMNDNTPNTVNWLTSTYQQTIGLYIIDNTSVLQTPTFAGGDSNSDKSNFRVFSVYIDKDVMISNIDDVELYRYYSATTSFPDWAVEGGEVRVGIFCSAGTGYFRNLKVTEY